MAGAAPALKYSMIMYSTDAYSRAPFGVDRSRVGLPRIDPRREQRPIQQQLEQHLGVAHVVFRPLGQLTAQQRIVDLLHAAAAVELVVVLFRRERVQCETPIAFEIESLRR